MLLACCLLLACLLAAKPSRSTLDTKKGYKTKTGSTSSVTVALTLALARLGSEFVLGSKMESNDAAKAAMNETWGILFSLINVVVWLEGGHGEVKGACDGPTLGPGGMYPQIAPRGPIPPTNPPGCPPPPRATAPLRPPPRPSQNPSLPSPPPSPKGPPAKGYWGGGGGGLVSRTEESAPLWL